MEVIRTQWPVGQGCFSSGKIKSEDSHGNPSLEFNYVYDCGARSKVRIEDAIGQFSQDTPNIDALFISHFDDDHVQGLDRLLSECRVDTVYVPYVNQMAPVLEVFGRFVDEDVIPTASTIYASLAPEAWLTARGVRRVVRIGRSPGGVPPDGPTAPLEPSPETGRRRIDLEDRQLPTTKWDTPSLLREQRHALDKSKDADFYLNGLAISLSDGWRVLPWQLVPYVHPVPSINYAKFRKVLTNNLGLKPRMAPTAKFLADLLRTSDGRKKIRACYDTLIPHGSGRAHNRISMSLFSGPHPTVTPTWEAECNPLRVPNLEEEFLRILAGRGLRIVKQYGACGGWIGTGDAKLGEEIVLKEWIKFYERLLAFTSTMLLPHHGSKNNFASELADLKNVVLYIAAADPLGKGYNHPSKEVRGALFRAHKILAHVEREPESVCIETIEVN